MTPVRRIAAEALGAAMLLAIVVGSGVMGQRLAGGNDAIALLGNTIATGAGLVVLIHMFAPLSGAHFNPAVTLALLLRGDIARRDALFYVAAQFGGAVVGVWAAHAMFAEPVLQVSLKLRDGWGQGLAEAIATFGLIGTILTTQRSRPDFTPVAVGLYITSAYWFTASTSFANPAVTVARGLTDSFAGIAPSSIPLFIASQIVGAVVALVVFGWLMQEKSVVPDEFPITIYHNPDCGTSRNALAMIEAAGYVPDVVDYRQSGWTRPLLEQLLITMDASPRDLLREKGTPAAELGLLDEAASDEEILAAMVEHPILVNRPIVVTPKGTKLCRPSEVVLTLLEAAPAQFTKEDGQVVRLGTPEA